MFLLATPLVRLFTDDLEVIRLGAKYTRMMTTVQWSYVMGFIFIGFLQAVKRPMYGLVESIVRKICLPLMVFYLMVRVWDVDLVTFWWSSVVINVAVVVLTIAYGRHILHKITN